MREGDCMVKVRFAPSPTGNLHIGGVRTALFNWMYARSQKGTFILRVEDTDQIRSKKVYEQEILRSMRWLGLEWDEIYYQSERFDLYKEYAEKLISDGKAYREGQAILLKMTAEEVKIYDIIRGEIVFDTANFLLRNDNGNTILDSDGGVRLKDEVLMKSDGSPSYSFCCAVDDALMGVTHVIRGEDHISNTPKQLLVYKALGMKPPKYAHLPLIMGEDGSRLSKRFGAVAVSDYKEKGFLAEAIVNYLMLLGWSPGNNQEIISLNNAVKKFTLKKVNNSAAIFSKDKLNWINGEHLKTLSNEEFVKRSQEFINVENNGYFRSVINLFKGRVVTLMDLVIWTDFFFSDDYVIEEGSYEKYFIKDKKEIFHLIARSFNAIENFTDKNIEMSFKEQMDSLKVKAGDFIHPLRVVLTGKTIGPSLFQIIALLGKEKVKERLEKVLP